MKKNKSYLIVLSILAIITFFSSYEFKKIKNRINPDYYLGNIYRGLKPYLVNITYYDWKSNDTVIVYYDHEPGNWDIKVWGTEGAYGSHQIPQFWSSSVFNDSTIIYLGVQKVKLLQKLYQ